MDEKKLISDEQLTSELKSKQAAGNGGKILEGIGTFIAIAGFLTAVMPLAILGVLLLLTGAMVSGSHKDSMTLQIGDQLVRGLLEENFDQVEYNPEGHVAPDGMGRIKMMLQSEFCEVDGSHHVKALYKGMPIEMSGISLIQEEDYYNDDAGFWEKIRKVVFEGQLLVCDSGRELPAEMKILARSGLNRLFSGSVVKTGNEEFDKRFIVQPEQEQIMKDILTPQVMDHILSKSAKYGSKIYMSFWKDGKLYIVIDTRQPFFSPGKGSVDASLLKQRFTAEIHWFTDFIDKLDWGA